MKGVSVEGDLCGSGSLCLGFCEGVSVKESL